MGALLRRAPKRARSLDNQRKFPPFVGLCQRIAGNRTGKAALRADRQPVQIDVTDCLVDAAEHRRKIGKKASA